MERFSGETEDRGSIGGVLEAIAMQPIRKHIPEEACTHSRLIDDVLTDGEKLRGKVRCLECWAVIDDFYRS